MGTQPSPRPLAGWGEGEKINCIFNWIIQNLVAMATDEPRPVISGLGRYHGNNLMVKRKIPVSVK